MVGDLNYTRRYFEQLFALTPADLKRVLRTYLVPEKLTVVSSNPKAESAKATPAAIAITTSLDFEEIKLPNGAYLLLQTNRQLPNLHLRLAFAGGALVEPAGLRGVNSLLSTLLTKDTARRSAEEVARAIEAVGGSFSDYSGNNSFGLVAEVLPCDATLALDLLTDAVLRPAFKPARLEIERESALAGLRESLDDVVTVGRKRLREKFFGAHPFAIESCGDEAGIKAVQPADLRKLQKRLLVAGNVTMAVAGDFNRKGLVPKLKAFLAKLPRGKLDMPAFATRTNAGEFVETQARQQAVVFQAYPGPALLAPDYYIGEVAEELFSGMSSNLFARVRELKSLAYFVRASRISGMKTGMFYFYAGTDPLRYGEVLEEFALEIARVQSGGVDESELRRCQTRLKAGKRMAMQTNSARAMQAAHSVVCGLPVNDWRSYDARIEAVTPTVLQAFAQKYFQPPLRTQLVVKP